MDELIKKGHELAVYEDSEKSDEKDPSLDALWQSIYDVLQIGTFGIIDLEQEEIEEAREWLVEAKEYTTKYKDTDIYF